MIVYYFRYMSKLGIQDLFFLATKAKETVHCTKIGWSLGEKGGARVLEILLFSTDVGKM